MDGIWKERFYGVKKRVADGVKAALPPLLNLVFPPRCLVCRTYLPPLTQMNPLLGDHAGFGTSCGFHPQEGEGAPGRLPPEELFSRLMAVFFCPDCLEGELTPFEPPFCTVCGRRFHSLGSAGDHICGECLAAGRVVGRVRAFGVYEAGLKQAIHFFKYNGKTGLATPLGLCLFFAFEQWFKENSPDIILPIPLHPGKLRSRGFNQAFLLIRDFKKYWIRVHGEPPPWHLEWRLLKRCRNTPSQTGLDQKKRQKNMKGAFRVPSGARIKKKRILLVDDVFTTGATTKEAAGVLLKKGAASVDVLVLARA